MSEQHYQDLSDIQDMLADAQQIAAHLQDYANKEVNKLGVLHAEIRKRIALCDVPMARELGVQRMEETKASTQK